MTDEVFDPRRLVQLDAFYAAMRNACEEIGIPWDDRTRRTLGLLAVNLCETIKVGIETEMAAESILEAITNASFYIAREGVPESERP